MERELELKGGGRLRVQQQGMRVQLDASRAEDGKGLYKVWLLGSGEGRMLLGTLMPTGGRLHLRRTLSVQELERGGCWPMRGGEARIAFALSDQRKWYCEQNPQRLPIDPYLRRQVSVTMLCCKQSECFFLAAPFRMDRPVALDTLFCLAWIEQIDGRPHWVWRFDCDGHPTVTHKAEQGG